MCCKPEKYKFYKKEVVFLGFLIDKKDIKMDFSKIKKVLDWSRSQNLKEFQEFLGFGNFNCWFIRDYLLIILLLMELTKKNISYK